MEQITNYFEHMDYVSFGVIALPCVVIAVYGFLQVASGLAKSKHGNMQRNNNNNNKRCAQKYVNGNLATTAYQQQQQQQQQAQPAHNNKCAARKTRYNNNSNNNNNKRQDAAAAYTATNGQKRNAVENAAAAAASGDASVNANANVGVGAGAWLPRSYGRRFVSSCVEDKFLEQQHNPGHRNSTSSEATNEDINSSSEHLNKSKGKGAKSRAKRQQQQPQAPKVNKAQPKTDSEPAASNTNRRQKGKQQQPNSQPRGNANAGNFKRQCQYNSSNNNINSSSNSEPKPGNNNITNNKRNNNNNNREKKLNGKLCGVGNIGGSTTDTSSALSSANSTPNSSPPGQSLSAADWQAGQRLQLAPSQSGAQLATPRKQRRDRHTLLQRHRQRQNLNFQVPPLRQYERIDMADAALVEQLSRHLIDHHLLRVYGFPVESVVHEGAIEIFKCLPHMNFAAAHGMSVAETLTVINCHDGLNTSTFQYSSQELGGGVLATATEPCRLESCSSSSSGDGDGVANPSTDSGNISPRSLDSESGSEWSECESAQANAAYSMAAADGSFELFCQYSERSLAKQCARCKRDFLVDEHSGQYLTREECSFHWGKYQRFFDGSAWVGRWTCCNATDEVTGCSKHELHVWTGSVVGVNGPYRDFVRTRKQRGELDGQLPDVYALDCEMSYTGRGLDVTKVSLVALNGQLVYEHFVRPDADIVDFNTRYSGITAKDLKTGSVKTLAEVQRDLLQLINADTILIGHGLDNDLRALRIVHNTLIDTSIAFPHSNGFPYRRALRHLTKTHLKREIQSGDGTTGHSSFEDSRACMELMLWRVRRELDADYWDE